MFINFIYNGVTYLLPLPLYFKIPHSTRNSTPEQNSDNNKVYKKRAWTAPLSELSIYCQWPADEPEFLTGLFCRFGSQQLIILGYKYGGGRVGKQILRKVTALLILIQLLGHYSFLYSMNQPDQYQHGFSIKLTQDQKMFIGALLPKGYSLQPATSNQAGPKNAHSRKININYKEESLPEKQQHEKQRRKIKSYQHIQPEQAKPLVKKYDPLSKMCGIVKKLKKHDSSWPFRVPVDDKALSIPNYNEIVLVRMDLFTIDQKIKSDGYKYPSEIERDINQIFLNSYKFNAKGSEYFQATCKLQQYYQNLVNQKEQQFPRREIPDKQKSKDDTPHKPNQNQKSNQVAQFQKDLLGLLKKANQFGANQRKVRQKPKYVSTKYDGPITLKEKRQLAQQIKSLEENHLGRIVDIIKQNGKQITSQSLRNQILGIDLQKLDHKTIRELQNYVRLQKNSVIHDKEDSGLDSHEVNYSVC